MNNVTEVVLRIQKASTAEELQDIQRMRYQVYSNEMGLELPGARHDQERLVEELDETASHLYMKAGDELVGAVRLNRDQVPRQLEAILEARSLPRPYVYCSRLYVVQKWRGSSIVSQLAQASFAEFYRLNAEAAICHCYPHLQRLYQRMGFRPYGNPFIQPGLDYLGWQRPMKCLLERMLRQTA